MDFSASEERVKRIAAMREEKERQLRNRALVKKYAPFALGGIAIFVVALSVGIHAHNHKMSNQAISDTNVMNVNAIADAYQEEANVIEESAIEADGAAKAEKELTTASEQTIEEPKTVFIGDKEVFSGYKANFESKYHLIGEEEIPSEFACLINASTGEIIAQKKALETMYPASMTKIMTVLVACENITDLDDKVTVTIECTDFAYKNDCSTAGFAVDEVVTVRDLLYGTILPSGGDAAYALALYVAGSQDAFVELMNKKVEELGLSESTHFTNCVGVFGKEHYSTCHDMAMILKAAEENDICREVLAARKYTTSSTNEHPEGITISNWFLRRIEDKDTNGEVLGAKTGFVNQSGCCAASYFVSENGVPYFCVTGNAYSSWRAIYDHVYLYSTYTK